MASSERKTVLGHYNTRSARPGLRRRAVLVPGGADHYADFIGNLSHLTFEKNWKQHGALTETESADMWRDAFYQTLDLPDHLAYADRCASIQPGLTLLHHTMQEGAGVVCHDTSGNGLSGVYNGVLLSRDGIGDGSRSVEFDGINDYIQMDASGLSAFYDQSHFSASCWVYIPAAAYNVATYRRVFEIGYSGTNRVYLYAYSGGRLWCAINENGNITVVGNITVPVSTWSQVFVTNSDAGLTIGMNGTPVASASTLGVAPSGVLANTFTRIGASGNFNVWWGRLAHFQLWDHVLTTRDLNILAVV